MPRPICFMIMPYDTKPTGAAEGSGAPDKVDFKRLWERALRPAIDKAGFEPVLANEDIGALIISEMIERLANSDLVLADVSIANGNVYYEVGIRHAARKQGCIMTAADWSKPLFDIDQMRRISYPLPDQLVSDDTASENHQQNSDCHFRHGHRRITLLSIVSQSSRIRPSSRYSFQEEPRRSLAIPRGDYRSAVCHRRPTSRPSSRSEQTLLHRRADPESCSYGTPLHSSGL